MPVYVLFMCGVAMLLSLVSLIMSAYRWGERLTTHPEFNQGKRSDRFAFWVYGRVAAGRDRGTEQCDR